MSAMAVADPTQISPEDAQKYAGQWVAIKDGRVVYGADDAKGVIDWVSRSKVEPDLVAALPAEGDPDTWLM